MTKNEIPIRNILYLNKARNRVGFLIYSLLYHVATRSAVRRLYSFAA